MKHEPGPPFSIGVIVLGGGALLLSAILFLGFLLPSDWEADASLPMSASAERVFGYLDSPEGWQAWTTWPDSGLVRAGPERGAGSMISWEDQELGAGSFRLVEADPFEAVSYAVEVGGRGGEMRANGTIVLRAEGDGVVVVWHEEGDLGRNPLMGFWAFFMSKAQSTELEKGLTRLGALASGGIEREAPADSASTDTSEASRVPADLRPVSSPLDEVVVRGRLLHGAQQLEHAFRGSHAG